MKVYKMSSIADLNAQKISLLKREYQELQNNFLGFENSFEYPFGLKRQKTEDPILGENLFHILY